VNVASSTSPMWLAGGELRDVRHVCGLFDGPEASYRTLLPFIVDGLRDGQGALHIVDPARRESHLARLTAAGVDVQGALEGGQLEVLTWESAYLRGGGFDRAAMAQLLAATMAEGRDRGYRLTRVIGWMDWATSQVPGVGDLATYEMEVDAALRGQPDPVICVYDLERHRTSLLGTIQGVHPLAIVDGQLRGRPGPAQPRDRILRAASELFGRRGIDATGVDTLIQVAGVAKATFYRQFPSKDDLVLAWLLDGRTRWLERVRGNAEASARSPEELIPRFFDAVAEWLEADDFRGCPYLNAAVEIVDPTHPARDAVRAYLSEVESYLRRALSASGHQAASPLAQQLQALLAGAISLSVAFRTPEPVLAARHAAMTLLRADDDD